MHGTFTRKYRAKLEKFYQARKDQRERRQRQSQVIDSRLSPAEIFDKAVKRWNRTHCNECRRKKPSSRKRLCAECKERSIRTRWRRDNNERADIRRRQQEEAATRGHSIQSSLFHLLPIMRMFDRIEAPH